MAAPRLRGRDGDQVDPFNAGEPELPWEEPDALDADGEKGDGPDGADEGPRAEYAPHGTPGGSPHKCADDYQAPVARGGSYDAPSTDEAAPAPKGGRRRARERRPRGCSGYGCAIAVVVVVLAISFGALKLVELITESGGSLGSYVSDNSDGTVVEPSDDTDRAALDAADAALADLLADPASGELHDAVASYLDQRCTDRLGLTAAELGVDTDAWATLLLGEVSYRPDEAFTYDDGTGSAWVYLTCPSAYDAFSEFYDAVWPYLDDEGLFDWGEPVGETLTEAQRAEVARLLRQAQGVDVTGTEMLRSYDVTYQGGAWVVDEGQVTESLRSGLDIY
ncbi:hypothetical protein [Thermophilibacter sp.]